MSWSSCGCISRSSEVRFEDRLQVRIAADADTTDALVPHMVLQPIVENAVRHALGQSEEGVTIDVKASATNGALTLVVSDNGPGLQPPARSAQSGIGLDKHPEPPRAAVRRRRAPFRRAG